jgi:hypothetical protein
MMIGDLEVLNAQELVLTHVQTTLAHRAPIRADAPVPTFGDLHASVDAVRQVFHRYYAILTHRTVVTFEPVAQFNVYTPFNHPWIADPERFDYCRSE